MLVFELRIEGFLNRGLGLGDVEAIKSDGAGFRDGDLALAIDEEIQAFGSAAPDVDDEAIAGSEDVVGAGRHVEGQLIGIAGAEGEDVASEAAEFGAGGRDLGVEVFEGGKIFVGRFDLSPRGIVGRQLDRLGELSLQAIGRGGRRVLLRWIQGRRVGGSVRGRGSRHV